MRFQITFGPDSRIVNAASEGDAWSAFCAVTPNAMKHPNLYKRSIECLDVETPEVVMDVGAVVAIENSIATVTMTPTVIEEPLVVEGDTGTVTVTPPVVEEAPAELQPAENTAEVENLPAMDPIQVPESETTEPV